MFGKLIVAGALAVSGVLACVSAEDIPDDVPSGEGCGDDLQTVLDSDGDVVGVCPPELGCFAGECVPACIAAGLAQGHVGCDFSLATPVFHINTEPPCFSAFVTNSWSAPVQVTVDRDGVSYDVTDFGRIATSDPDPTQWPAIPDDGIPPGEVGVLFLSHDPNSENGDISLACPITPALSQPFGTTPGEHFYGPRADVGKAWKIRTDVPVSTYDILPFGGASSFLPSAQLLFPTTSWGSEYLAIAPPSSNYTSQVGGPTWIQVVATADNTVVELTPAVDLPEGLDIPPMLAGVETNFTLQAGEYLQWQFAEADGFFDPTGTLVKSDKPVAVVGGTALACYRSETSTTGGGCDSTHQMVPPLHALGVEYVGAPYTTRGPQAESVLYRVVGVVDNTKLVLEPPVLGAPDTIHAGDSVVFESTHAFRVKSQDANHPFYIAQMMPGANVNGVESRLGDEEYVNMLPPAQFLKSYVFFTDPSYPTTNLVFVRQADSAGAFADVELECFGTVTGWETLGASDYQFARVDLIRDGVPQGECTNGPQFASSDHDFGIVVWGMDEYSSYAYPAGGSALPINDVVID